MKKIITSVGVALALSAALVPAAAQASPIRECGDIVADGVVNITTLNVSCSDARSFADKFSYLAHWYSGWVTLPSWHAYLARVHYEPYNQHVDVRATRTYHVIHFQIGPYGVSDGGYNGGKCAGVAAGQPC
jgi:hypothetical protein